MSMIKVKAVALHRKGRPTELHEEGCGESFKRGFRQVHRVLLLETKAELKELAEEFKMHDCITKATERKRGRSHKNPNRVASNPPKSARYYRLLLVGESETKLVIGWRRHDGMFCAWLVHPNGKYVLHPDKYEDHRTFLLLADSDIKRKQRMVMDTRRHKLAFPKQAIMMSSADARETGNRSKREAYVSKKIERRMERIRQRKAKEAAKAPAPRKEAPPKVSSTSSKRNRPSTVGEFVVATGINQETGTVTQVLDMTCANGNAPEGLTTRWAVQCVDHETTVAAEGKREAKRMRAHPSGWCSECKG